MSLPFDICRCMGINCPEVRTLNCLRYLDRATGSYQTPIEQKCCHTLDYPCQIKPSTSAYAHIPGKNND